MRGPYQFTRNPMYLSGMAIWLGWVIFYGSVAVFVGFVVGWVSVIFLVVPWEERKLEARFGDAYLQYKNTVPRWLGRGRADRPQARPALDREDISLRHPTDALPRQLLSADAFLPLLATNRVKQQSLCSFS